MPAASFDTPITLMLSTAPATTLTIATNPVLTVHSLITGAVTGSLGTESRLRTAVLDALGADGLALYRYIRAGSGRVFYPRLIVPAVDHTPRWAVHAREAIADSTVDQLVEQLIDMQRLHAGRGWEDVIARPRPWLNGIASAFARVALAIRPWWTQATARLAVEEARLEMVGATAEGRRRFVNELTPMVRLDDDALRIKWTQTSIESAGGEITLTPMVVPRPHSYVVFKTATGTAYGYPMAAALREIAAPPAHRLEALLGPHRSDILRRLDRPRTHTDVAESLGIVMSTTNYHVEKLRTSGLITTVQLGRTHWILRTAAGDALLDLLD